MFIDEMTITAKAGNGGNGVVRWIHEKGKEFGGAAGGDGGKGGSVVVVGVRDASLLSKYRNKKEFNAPNGEDGRNKGEEGENGKDLEIKLPIGSVITNTETQEKYSLNEEGEKIKILQGSLGGRGNKSFKSSTNVKPTECTEGKIGQEAEFYIEVELIADLGLIGLPNAGKSSFLNEVTKASAKVGAYPFTTLEPNLGERFGYIIADIPGLIEGASSGKGLGHKFLRHIRRTKVLVHFVSLENKDVVGAYKTIRKELADFDKELGEKREIVVLSKIDTVTGQKLKEAISEIKKENPEVLTLTILDEKLVKETIDTLLKYIEKEQA